MAEVWGHTLAVPRPSLVPMETEEDWCRELMGLSLRNVSVTLKKDKKKFMKILEKCFSPTMASVAR